MKLKKFIFKTNITISETDQSTVLASRSFNLESQFWQILVNFTEAFWKSPFILSINYIMLISIFTLLIPFSCPLFDFLVSWDDIQIIFPWFFSNICIFWYTFYFLYLNCIMRILTCWALYNKLKIFSQKLFHL